MMTLHVWIYRKYEVDSVGFTKRCNWRDHSVLRALLFLQRTQVWFSIPTRGSQPSVNSNPRGSNIYSGLSGHQAQMCTGTHGGKTLIHIQFRKSTNEVGRGYNLGAQRRNCKWRNCKWRNGLDLIKTVCVCVCMRFLIILKRNTSLLRIFYYTPTPL